MYHLKEVEDLQTDEYEFNHRQFYLQKLFVYCSFQSKTVSLDLVQYCLFHYYMNSVESNVIEQAYNWNNVLVSHACISKV